LAAIKQEVNVPLVVTIGVVSGILLLVVVIGVQAWYQSEEQSEMAAKEKDFPNIALMDLKTTQAAAINTWRWIDQKKGVIAMPIEQAMQEMVRTQGNFPSTQPSSGEAQR
jgi:hypothetical protein